MRIQFNLPAWFLLVTVAAIVAYRFSPDDRLNERFLERFARSHMNKDQSLIAARQYKRDGVSQYAFVFGERNDPKSIGAHFILITDRSLLPVAWHGFAYDCELSAFDVDDVGRITVNRLLQSGQRSVTKYHIDQHSLVTKTQKQWAIRSGGGNTLSPDQIDWNIDYALYQKLGDRREGEPVGRWGNK